MTKGAGIIPSRNVLHSAFPEAGNRDPSTYFTELGDDAQALMYSWLYWPRLVEAHGAVFVALSEGDEIEIPARLLDPVGDRNPDWPEISWQDAVDSFNFFELAYLFRQSRGNPELQEEVLRELGGVLVQTWSARLAGEYPGRRFDVSLVEPDESLLLRVQVTQNLVTPTGWDGMRRAVVGAGASSIDTDVRRPYD